MVDCTEGAYMEFCRGGLQRKKFQRLKSGQHDIDAEIELHGMTAAEAQRALHDFLTHALAARHSVVLIIHGKGLRSPAGSVLKPLTSTYLKTIAEVQAFCSAQPADGDTGALYVLLGKVAGGSDAAWWIRLGGVKPNHPPDRAGSQIRPRR